MHCIEDREFNNLHRMVTIIYAGKQDTLQALRDVEFSIFSDRNNNAGDLFRTAWDTANRNPQPEAEPAGLLL